MLSVVSYPERGTGGNNKYRGNCSPKLIEDIIDQYGIKSMNDYMVGSGTTEDVIRARGLEGKFFDLNRGYDMMNMHIPERAENIFWHPPYDDIIVYSDKMYKAQDIINQYGFDPRVGDLSRCNGWEDFVQKMNYCCMKQFNALDKGGRMFILMGDIKKKGKLYSMINEIAKPGTMEQIIIKMQHNCWSDRQTYSGKFVPIVHEYLLVLRKDQAMIYPVLLTATRQFDVRDSVQGTWRDLVVSVLEDYGASTLQQIYSRIDGHKKCASNPNWQAKVRQVLQVYNDFEQVDRGVWQKAA